MGFVNAFCSNNLKIEKQVKEEVVKMKIVDKNKLKNWIKSGEFPPLFLLILACVECLLISNKFSYSYIFLLCQN